MATKWTKFKYSSGSKALMSIIILASGTVLIWCFLWMMIYGGITKDELADNHEYSNEFLQCVYTATDLAVNLKNIENINSMVVENEDDRVDLYRRYNRSSEQLNEKVNFIYCIRDLNTNRIVKTNTKMKPDLILEQENHVFFSEHTAILDYGSLTQEYELSNYLGYTNNAASRYMGDEILSLLSQERYEIYAGVQDHLQEGDIFYNLYIRSNRASQLLVWWQQMLLISSVVFAAGLILIAFQCGKNSRDNGIQINGFDRIFTELQCLGFLGLGTLIFLALDSIFYNSDLINNVSEVSIQLGVAAFLSTLIGLVFYCSLIRQIKGRILFKTSFLGVCFRGLKNIFWRLEGVKLLKPSWLFFFIAYGGCNVLAGILIDDIGIIIFVFTQVIFGYVFLKQLAALKEIMQATKRVSAGELDIVLDTERFPKVMVDFYDNIYHVQSDMRLAIKEAVKGERMKAELITNVSHDLKTPLTSIVSYVDLLSKEPLETEASKEYVEILIKKSDMLKRLIEDLIDASKVSTGNVQMTCSDIDLNELIRQSIGEFEERFAYNQLDVRVQEEDDLIILADGKAMWRVIENVFDNIAKYALANSRVYIQLIKQDHKAVIVVKNISANPLEISPEELMQRFVRGSESRTSEGSGLGLSIAEGLIEAQDGDFEVVIDGDLFKVKIAMPMV